MTDRLYISGDFSDWPLRQIVDDDGQQQHTAICAPPRDGDELEQVRKFVDAGNRLIGISSYQSFPGRIVYPGADSIERDFDVWKECVGSVRGWIHCMRQPQNYIPEFVPSTMLAESDFTCYDRITPNSADGREITGAKQFDVLYVCGPGEWNRFCRNWALGMRCLKELCSAGYRVAIVGASLDSPISGRTSPIEIPPLQWYEFLEVIASSRILMVPNIFDASPRILAEAQCLDVPILVNRHIVGGWHYVNESSGRFFSSSLEVTGVVDEILNADLEPRMSYVERFGPRRSGEMMARFLDESGA